MSKSILQNIPEAEKLLEMKSENLVGYLLEHLHSIKSDRITLFHPGNLADSISRTYPLQFRERINKKIFQTCTWLTNKGYIAPHNNQGFFDFTEEGERITTADGLKEFNMNYPTENKDVKDNLPVINLSEPELLWLREVYEKFKAGKETDIKALRVKLRGRIPPDFDPEKIDNRLLLHGYYITLYGMWHVDPNTTVLDEADLVIRAIGELIFADTKRETVTAEEVANLTQLPQAEVEMLIKQIRLLGVFWSDVVSASAIGYKEVKIKDKEVFDKHYQYQGIEQLISKSSEKYEPSKLIAKSGAEEPLHSIPPKHGVDVAAKYIFLDVVGFTRHDRKVEAQADIVKQLNEIVSETIKEKAVLENKRIFIPTGDGMCIALLGVENPADIHIQIALSILDRLNEYNTSIDNETRRFQVRIGIEANTDTLVVDINNQQNIAGAGISMASRIMNLADENQILVGDGVYNVLKHRERYASAFMAFNAIVKHDTRITVYQFVGEGYDGLNIEPPMHFQAGQENSSRKANIDYVDRAQRAAAIYPIAEELLQHLRDLQATAVRSTDASITEINHLQGEINGLLRLSRNDVASQMILKKAQSELIALRNVGKSQITTVKTDENDKAQDDVPDISISPLEISFEQSAPYFQVKPSGTSSGVLQYRSDFRVGIKNRSDKTINNVMVKIEELSTGKASYSNIPLRILHDNQPYRNEFSLHPEEEEILEVATRETWEKTITICRTNRVNAPDNIPANQEYEFTIKATGLDIIPCKKRFLLVVKGDGKLDVSVIEK